MPFVATTSHEMSVVPWRCECCKAQQICSCRPAIVLSYLISAFAALLSALSYTEFVVDLPIAGGAFNYISLVFGELTAWCGQCLDIASCTAASSIRAHAYVLLGTDHVELSDNGCIGCVPCS